MPRQHPGHGRREPATTRRRSCSPTTSPRCARTRPARRFGDGLFRAEGPRGTCRVVCFSPRHDLTLAGMDDAGDPARRRRLGRRRPTELGERYRWVQVFENRGAAMGASATRTRTARSGRAMRCRSRRAREDARSRPTLPRRATRAAARLRGAGAGRSARDPWTQDGLADARAVLGGLAVRDAARCRSRPAARLAELDGHAAGRPRGEPAATCNRRYDALFRRPVPVLHGLAPGARSTGDWDRRLAAPRALLPAAPAAASVRKFMVGYELLAEPQRDLTPGGGGRPSARRAGLTGRSRILRRYDGRGTTRRNHAALGRSVRRRTGRADGGLHPVDRGRRRARARRHRRARSRTCAGSAAPGC